MVAISFTGWLCCVLAFLLLHFGLPWLAERATRNTKRKPQPKPKEILRCQLTTLLQ